MPPPSSTRALLLTLDAFNTVYQPRGPIADLYIQIARSFDLPRVHLLDRESLGAAFKATLQAQMEAYPNYGREQALRGRYGGARQWWEEVVRESFIKGLWKRQRSQMPKDEQAQITKEFVDATLDLFSGQDAYQLKPGAKRLFEYLAQAKTNGTGPGQWDRLVVGVISNSDDRVPAILQSLGLRVGQGRADEAAGFRRLPGFEKRGRGRGRGRAKPSEETVHDIDFVVTSYEAGVVKPDRRIFELAERQAEKVVGQKGGDEVEWTRLHVGDDLEADYRGSIAAGWGGLYAAQGHGLNEIRQIEPGDVIGDLDDLPQRFELGVHLR